jgi:hypothetical protein
LSDQAATFLSRNEAEVRIRALAEKLDTETARNSARIGELELRLTSRLDLRDGASKGVGQGLSWMTVFGGLVLLCIALVGFVVVR